jgi:integrase
MGEFMRDLRTRNGIAARALEFLTLCVCRTGDIIGNQREEKPPMRWEHVDFAKRLWTIPSTKTDKRHIVPLSDAAMAILEKMRGCDDKIVFPGANPGQPLSNAAMGAVIDRMNDDGGNYIDPKEDDRAVVPHGLRSSFRSWAGDYTSFDHQTIEFALAHQIDDKTERAYARSTAVEKRRRLMTLWSQHCGKLPPKVLPFAKVLDGSQRRV